MMKSNKGPDEHHDGAFAAPISAAGDSAGRADLDSRADGMLVELGRFVQRVSAEGVHTPLDRALLAGAKRVFESLLTVCDELSEQQPEPVRSDHVMQMEIAGFNLPEPESELDSVGPDEPERPPRRTKKKATSKKKTSSGKRKTRSRTKKTG